MIIFISSCVIAIFVSFLCSLAEAVLLTLNPIRLETLKRQGKKHAAYWLTLRQNIGRPIAAILILNTIAHTGGATVAGSAFDEIYGDEWIWLFSALFTFIILFGTELIPKVLGVSFNERLAPLIAPGLRVSIAILKPIIFLSELVSQLFQRRLESSRTSLEDLRSLAKVAKTEGVIEVEQEQIILNASKLRETRVKSIMLPREWIIFLKTHHSIQQNFEIARNNLHTRYPISNSDSVDGIIGYINFKELGIFEAHLSTLSIDQFIRRALFVSAETNLNTMLKLFISKRNHLALVKDHQGTIIGMVTLEDVIEEIAGDIEDEFDESFSQIIRVGPKSWRVGGSVQLDALHKQLGLPFDSNDLSQTIAHWLQAKISGAIFPGALCQTPAARFIAQQVRRGKIYQILICLNPPLERECSST